MNKTLGLGIAIFAISGLFLTGINYQTASAGPATEAALLLALVAAHHDPNGTVNLVTCTVVTNNGDTIIVGSRIGDVNNGRVIKATIDRDASLSSVSVTCLLDNSDTTPPVVKEVKKKGTTVIIVSDPGVGIPSPG